MSYLQIIRELKEQRRLMPPEAGSQPAPTLGNELDEKDELNPTLADCRSCLCDDYTIRLRESCLVCQGAICSCGGCIRASRAWRYADREPPTSDLPLDQLLARLCKGSRWLQIEHERCYDDALDDNAELAKMSATWDELEEVLRHTHGYQGCIFGEGQRCPDPAPLRCTSCAESDGDR